MPAYIAGNPYLDDLVTEPPGWTAWKTSVGKFDLIPHENGEVHVPISGKVVNQNLLARYQRLAIRAWQLRPSKICCILSQSELRNHRSVPSLQRCRLTNNLRLLFSRRVLTVVFESVGATCGIEAWADRIPLFLHLAHITAREDDVGDPPEFQVYFYWQRRLIFFPSDELDSFLLDLQVLSSTCINTLFSVTCC